MWIRGSVSVRLTSSWSGEKIPSDLGFHCKYSPTSSFQDEIALPPARRQAALLIGCRCPSLKDPFVFLE